MKESHDATEVVNLWKSQTFERADSACAMQEVKELCGNFTSFSLSYLCWTGSQFGSHLCAQASEIRRMCLWINFVSNFLRDCITC